MNMYTNTLTYALLLMGYFYFCIQMTKTTVYCYTCVYNNESFVVGFMDASNHEWDSDCFHIITSSLPFIDTVSYIEDYIKERGYSIININGDSYNWMYSIQPGTLQDIMNTINLLFTID